MHFGIANLDYESYKHGKTFSESAFQIGSEWKQNEYFYEVA